MAKKGPIISFLIDRSGSMASVRSDVIGGFNSFLKEQKDAKEEDCRFVFTLFDSSGVDIKKFKSIQDVPELTTATYVPGAMTPLLDAIGKTIKATSEMKKSKDVLFVIYTDGQENSSHEYTRAAVKALIKDHEEAGWGFLFLGADMNAYGEASTIGISASTTFSTAGVNTGATYAAVSDAVQGYRGAPGPQGVQGAAGALKEEEERQNSST